MCALAWDEPLAWVTWKVVAVPAGGIVPRDGEGDAVLACGCVVGVAGLWRGGDGLGCGGGLGSEG